MQAFSIVLVGELLTLINVVSLCFIFLRIYIFCKCIMPSMSMFASLAYIALPWHLFLHLAFNATASHLNGACSYIAHAPLLFLHHKFSCIPLVFFLHHFVFLCFNMFLKSMFSCSLTLLFDLSMLEEPVDDQVAPPESIGEEEPMPRED
jgi:hypothetical protein